jgi:hypothetical protein
MNSCPDFCLSVCGEQKAKYAILWLVVLRTCKVSIRDIRDIEHTVDVRRKPFMKQSLLLLRLRNKTIGWKKFRRGSTRSEFWFNSPR